MRTGVADEVWNADPAPPAPAYPGCWCSGAFSDEGQARPRGRNPSDRKTHRDRIPTESIQVNTHTNPNGHHSQNPPKQRTLG